MAHNEMVIDMEFETFQLENDLSARRYETHVSRFMAPFVESILDVVEVHDGESILDVACGTGRVARGALTRASDVRATGVDLNKGMLSVAKSTEPAIRWINAPADRIPLEDGAFDAITCQQGMQFFPDPRAAAAEMVRLATSGARIGVTVWAPLEHNPYFEAQAEALEQFIDPASARGVRMAVRPQGDDFLVAAFEGLDVAKPDVRRLDIKVTFDDVATFAREQIASTPWAPAFQKAEPTAQDSFVDHMANRLKAYESTGIPFSSWLLTTTRN